MDLLPTQSGVQGDGLVEVVGESLGQNALKPDSWLHFKQSLRELAASRERKAGAFEEFAEHLDKTNFSIFLDAANIAFYNTHFLDKKDKFQWLNVKRTYEKVQEAFPGKRALVIMHNYRCGSAFVKTGQVANFVNKLTARSLSSCRLHCRVAWVLPRCRGCSLVCSAVSLPCDTPCPRLDSQYAVAWVHKHCIRPPRRCRPRTSPLSPPPPPFRPVLYTVC
jgi:hypothetical protein